ncbi:hypothetical protein NOF04DRAFT_6913 [Fusarium oxysporum II5]|uniref:Fungal N-terminal domain-containing protein n=1 Tax=Fusarium odoratissimum (strain NRRL 54006) TaxID=1089451 RepID=X0J999_FUSO5|nr:uncharacterized protein FOIG_10042 [Fusarium odoratissimum NRRL 54006]EXL97722.1 hypothetical protein FOIG_10042 [Fusarium odoratissimum NRRL 54006]KAK2122687.1 hypothetical protein NOF04DRAFT_6913 [Fusarium oxysporum II5]
MAEAFGIAGSAFGTVSLGLQLFKEISQYLDDIDGREEDLKQARNFATNIQVSINALDVAISNAPTDDPTTNSAIGSCRDSCVSAVNNLLALVKELRGPIISIPNSNAARAKGLCAKLKYPFKKQSIEKLEENLSRTNSALQTMLQVFQLNTGRTTTSAIKSMHQTVADVNVILDKNETTLDEMHKTSQLHDNRLSAIQRDVRDLLILTRDSDDSKLLLRPMAEQMSDLTSHTSVAPKLLQDPASDTFTPSIQTTSYQGGGSMTFDAFCSCKTQRIRYSQRQWGPFLLEAEVRSRDHHAPECPMSKLPASTCRTKRVLSLLTPSSQRLWGRAGRVSLSFTTGAGILGIGQTVAWIATVDERVSPVFRLADTIASYQGLPRKDMHMLLASGFRRLVWCYANSHASVTDVNEDGETILESALHRYTLPAWHDALSADNMAELYKMLTIIAEPTSCTRKITAKPIPAIIATSSWFYKCTRPDEVATTILSKYREPLGHHPHDWGLSWWRDKDHVGDGYRLFQAFPQVVENLEFGPLTQAVIKQDRNGVQRLLERCPSYINEANYCGQSPVHLAIETQNIAVISVVLHYADAKALRARDNRGYYPIDYVTKRFWKRTKEPQADCEGCKVLEMLLRLDTPLLLTSLRVSLRSLEYGSHSCIHGRKTIIRGLVERREDLKELSYRKLSPDEREGLEIHQTRILDRNAAQVQHQLEAQGCPMPTRLSVYTEDIGSSYYHESVYSIITNGEVAEYAHQLGFYYSDNEFADFICILVKSSSYFRWINPFSSSYLCWMIDHGTSISSRIPVRQPPSPEIEATAAHYFMASLGISDSLGQNLTLDSPLTIVAIKVVFSETVVDGCRCWCSPGGCTPLMKLLEGISGRNRIVFGSQQSLSRETERLINGLLSAHWGQISDCQWIYAAIIRYYTFVTLGLRHVCCSIIKKISGPLPEEELQEIEEEDSSLLGLFESLVTEFEDGRCHDMSLEEFFEWMHMNWAPRMQEVREELASKRLTDQELRDAESIGVVWEVHGPQPMRKRPDLPRWGQGGLWNAMDQLDQIATDPERPTKESLQTQT